MTAPERYIEWVNSHLGFNPRSQQNSDALSSYVVEDLLRCSPQFADDYQTGRIQTVLNAAVRTRIAQRDVDLVLVNPAVPGPLNRVRLAVENKTIMTAHGKARKNRYGDLIAYANHIHNHSLRAIAGAIVIVNVNPTYRNPDPFATGIERRYLSMEKIVTDTVKIFTDIPLREREDEPNDQPEGIAVLVVNDDGANPGRLVTARPAPQPEDPTNYDTFIQRLCRLYQERG